MATLIVYKKPSSFNLSQQYRRIKFNESPSSYTYCKKHNDIAGYEVYQIGVYYEENVTISFPGPRNISPKNIVVSKFYKYNIYIPLSGNDTNRIFCVGPRIELLNEAIKKHTNSQSLNTITINLNSLDSAAQSGQLGIYGQTCLTDGGTIKQNKRKTDGLPFNSSTQIERGADVINECFELLVPVDTKHRPVYVYPNGTITQKGRPELEGGDFNTLKLAYDLIKPFST
jgi:hypothetical protein